MRKAIPSFKLPAHSQATYFAPHRRLSRRVSPSPSLSAGWPEQILLVYNVVEYLSRGHDYELVSENEGIRIAEEIEHAIGDRIQVVQVSVSGANLEQTLQTYSPDRALIFNLCEGLDGLPHLEAAAAARMRTLGFHLTGNPASALALCQNKVNTKQLLAIHGLPTPTYQVMRSPDMPLRLPYPLIVKPMAEDASLGIERNAVCTDATGLRERVSEVIALYKQPALVEEFIMGREFNISVWGNSSSGRYAEALPIAELEFFREPNPLKQVVSYASKWLEVDPEQWLERVIVPAAIDEKLAAYLAQLAVQAFTLTGCSGYARIDMRLRGDQAYILEVNPNPAIATDAGFPKAAAAAGYSYAQMIEHIIQLAIEKATRGDSKG